MKLRVTGYLNLLAQMEGLKDSLPHPPPPATL